jgi:hypothetical protein
VRHAPRINSRHNVICSGKRPRLTVPLALVLSLVIAAPAVADSVATEQQRGAQVLSHVRHGALSTNGLTTDQYENLGEYLMGRALGSTQLHQRMNTLMDQMMGPAASDQMHIYLAKRHLGVNVMPGSRYGDVYRLMGVMMSSYRGSPLAGMMARYLNGHGSAGYSMGPGMMSYPYGSVSSAASSGGWSTGALVGIAVGTLLLGGGFALLVLRLRRRAHRATPTTG